MSDYLLQGIWELIHGAFWASVVYLCIFSALLIKKQGKFASLNKYRLITGYILLLYLFAILGITGISLSRFQPDNIANGLAVASVGIPFYGASLKMVLLNTFLFIPYGFLASLFWKEKIDLKKILIIGLCTSAVIECLQIFTGRFPELDDLLANTLGCVYGYSLYKIGHGILHAKDCGAGKNILKRTAVVLLSGCIYIVILFFAANGDSIQEEEFSRFSEMGTDEQIEAIDRAVIYRKGHKRKVNDELIYSEWYRFIGDEFSNRSSQYAKTGQKTELPAVSSDDLYIEFQFGEEQNFTFYNNEKLQIGPMDCIRYNLKNGDFYSGSRRTGEYEKYQYQDAEHPFDIDEELYIDIQSY